MASFLKTIKNQEELTEFDVDLWCNTIDWIIVKSKKRFYRYIPRQNGEKGEEVRNMTKR
ncbi:hypothetical protein O3794_05610 [Gemella sanguinis]|uniref:hypothetical protein n=1 Tax=Gemella sanguinis TaxID=84135 RepID=UPI00352E844A